MVSSVREIPGTPPPVNLEETLGPKGAFAGANLAQRTIRGGVWVFVGRIVGLVAALAVEIIVGRTLPLDDFGGLAVLSSMITFGSGLAMFGMNGTLVRLIGESLAQGDKARASQAIRIGTLFSFAAGLIIAVFGGTVLNLALPGDVPRSHYILIVSAVTMAVYAWQQIPAESLRAVREQRWANLLSGGQIGGPATLVLYATLFSIAAALGAATFHVAVWLKLVAVVIVWPFSVWCLRRAVQNAFEEETVADSAVSRSISAREILAICGPLTIVHFLNLAAITLDIVLAGWNLSAGDAALYAAGKRFAVLVGVPVQVMQMTVVGVIADLYARGQLKELETLLRRCAFAATIVSACAWFAVLVAGRWGFVHVMGASFADAYWPLLILSLGHLLVSWTGCTHFTLVMTGRHNIVLATNCVSLGLLLFLGPFVASKAGAVGLASVVVGGQFLQQLIQWVYARHSVGVWTHASWPRSDALIKTAGRMRAKLAAKRPFAKTLAPAIGSAVACASRADEKSPSITEPNNS